MADFDINQAFSNDESIEYPPPPPPDYTAPYGDEAGGHEHGRALPYEHNENEFEQTLSQHDLAVPYEYDEEYDSGEHTDLDTVQSEKRQPLSKKKVFGLLAMVLVVIVAASSIAASKNRRAGQSNASVAESNAALVAPTTGPTKSPMEPSTESPVAAPTKDPESPVAAPTKDPESPVAAPTKDPESPVPSSTEDPAHTGTDHSVSAPSNSHHNTPSHPTAPIDFGTKPIHDKVVVDEFPDDFCQNAIVVSKDCYTFGESIEIEYRFCDPGVRDWFGVFRPNSHNAIGRMRMMPYYWEYSCGGNGNGCESPSRSGTMTLNANLSRGRYMMYGLSGVARPYQSVASSAAFVVAKNCGSDFSSSPYS
eukprot:jgi/Psemu1/188566/e_gw1.79.31.1